MYLRRCIDVAIKDFPVSRKVLGLVLVPLVAGLLFGAVLFGLLVQAEREAAAEDHAKTVMFNETALQRSIAMACMSAISYCNTYSQSQLDSYVGWKNECHSNMELLLAATAGQPLEGQAAKGLEQQVLNVLASADEVVKLASLGRHIAPLKAIVLKRDVETFSHSFVEEAQRLKLATQKTLALSGFQKTFYRSAAKYLVLLGVFASVASSLLIARLVSRGITMRIDSLIHTTMQVASGEKLSQPLQGLDELSRLDKFVRHMVATLNEAHMHEKANLQTIMNNMPVGLALMGRDGNIELCNPTFLQITGTDATQVRSCTLAKLFPAATEMSVEKTGQFVTTKPDGSNLAIDFAVVDLIVEDVPKDLCIVNDVSDKFELEQMKRDFVSMVGHDLRSPLTSLQCTLAMLESGVFGELSVQGQKNVKSSTTEIARLMRLVNSLLDYGKMESGQLQLTIKEIKADAIALQALDSVRSLARRKEIEIAYEGVDVIIQADEDKIVQVLINLLSNALKYSPTNTRVVLRVEKVLGAIKFAVIDQGRGIPDKFKSVIFDRYKQVQSDDEYSGFGLGLAISKLIVERHSGKIGVESSEGQGSMFWFSLPLEPSSVVEQSVSV